MEREELRDIATESTRGRTVSVVPHECHVDVEGLSLPVQLTVHDERRTKGTGDLRGI